MTVTETTPDEAPAAVTEAADDVLDLPPRPLSGIGGVLATADHKVVGKLFIFCSLLFLGASLVVSALVALEGGVDAATAGDVLDGNAWYQMYTLSQVGLVLLGVIPALLGLGIYVVPLQVGSPSIAFPRLAAASFWGWLVGSGLVIASYAINGGPGGGDQDGVLLSLTSLGVVIISLLGACICLVTTVGTLRTHGLTMLRLPTFAWSLLVASTVWLLTLPVLGANLLLIYLDADHGAQSFGQPLNMWPQLRWLFEQPAALAVAIPVLGIAGDIVPVIGRSKIAKRGPLLGAIAAFGVLTFGPWAQTAFNPRLVEQAVFIVFSVAVGLPVLAFLGGLADALRRGRPQAKAALPLAMVAVLATLAACAAAAARAIDPLNLVATMWGSGVAKLAIGAAVAGLVAGVHFWGPKMYGVHPNEGLGKLNVLLLLGGVALFGGGDLLAGGLGQLPAGADGAFASVADGAELGLVLSAVGAALLVGAVVLALLAQLPALGGKGVYAGADPWGGHTLEWTTTSPPPYGNFLAAIGDVTSSTPLLDVHEENA